MMQLPERNPIRLKDLITIMDKDIEVNVTYQGEDVTDKAELYKDKYITWLRVEDDCIYLTLSDTVEYIYLPHI